MFDHVFSPYTIRGKTIKNRFTVPAMVTDYCNEDGTATERYIAYHEEKAKGGWGLIITEDYNVVPEGRGFKATAGLWEDSQIESHKELTKRVHKHGATILAQIYHCGRQTNTGALKGLKARGASHIMCPFGDDIPEPLTTDEVKEIVQRFGDTALRAKKAGFDGVELHAAHGYLIQQFFSPYSNKRLDEYGGNFWNRTRFGREIVKDVREKCGEDFIIGMRLSSDEFVEGGLSIEDTKIIAKMMQDCGVDILHVTASSYLSVGHNVTSSHFDHGWLTDWSKKIKEVLHIPVILVSRINDPFLADSIIASEKSDFIAMGRASLVDPAMPNKAKEHRFDDIRRCIGCNDGCVGVLFTDNPITCVLNPELGHEYRKELKEASEKKNVAIVGAGPAGLSAAISAAKSGHAVTVYEKNNDAGGNFYVASIPPTKGEITDFIVWQKTQCQKLGIEIKYNTEATTEMLTSKNYDSIILATGSVPSNPPIKGLEGNSKVVNAEDVLLGKVIPGKNNVVIGGGQVGTETAHFLTQLLRNVTVLEMQDAIASDAYVSIQWALVESLEKRHANLITNATVLEINDESVVYSDMDDNEITVPADTIVVATGYKAYNPLEEELRDHGIPVKVIGDAVEARKVDIANREGYLAGINA